MKKIFLVFSFVLVTNSIFSQIINIPDANFKYFLVHAGAGDFSGVAGNSLTSNLYVQGEVIIDTNHDNEISQQEAAAIIWLNLLIYNSSSFPYSILDLTGIEYFVNLRLLNCNGHLNLNTINLVGLGNLEALDISNTTMGNINLSSLIHLKKLLCSHSYRGFINLAPFPDLQLLDCSNNSIWQLNFNNSPNLQAVNCSNNALYTLDFANAPMLNDLSCKNNPNLTTIKIKNGVQHLPRTSQNFQECMTGCPNLNLICADANEISIIQNDLTSCGITQNIAVNTSCVLANESFSNNQFSISPNPSNNIFNISFGNVVKNTTIIEVYNILGQKIFAESVVDKDVYIFDASNLPTATYLLRLINNEEVIIKKLIKN